MSMVRYSMRHIDGSRGGGGGVEVGGGGGGMVLANIWKQVVQVEVS